MDTLENERIIINTEHLSTRLINILRDNKIYYIDQLVSMSTRDIVLLENAGKKSLNEIRAFLANLGLSLSDESADPAIKKIILQDLPSLLFKISLKIDEAHKELSYFSLKVDQLARKCKNGSKKAE